MREPTRSDSRLNLNASKAALAYTKAHHAGAKSTHTNPVTPKDSENSPVKEAKSTSSEKCGERDHGQNNKDTHRQVPGYFSGEPL
jgi:hypothetical protein